MRRNFSEVSPGETSVPDAAGPKVAGNDGIKFKNTTDLRAVPLNAEAHRTHKIERVAARNNPGSHPVIEDQPSVFEPVFKMHVPSLGRQIVRHSGKRQIVGRRQPHRAIFE